MNSSCAREFVQYVSSIVIVFTIYIFVSYYTTYFRVYIQSHVTSSDSNLVELQALAYSITNIPIFENQIVERRFE